VPIEVHNHLGARRGSPAAARRVSPQAEAQRLDPILRRLIGTLLLTGARLEEVLGLTLADVKGFAQIDARHLILSYSSAGVLRPEEIEGVLRDRGVSV
jgi:hypothetical protein